MFSFTAQHLYLLFFFILLEKGCYVPRWKKRKSCGELLQLHREENDATIDMEHQDATFQTLKELTSPAAAQTQDELPRDTPATFHTPASYDFQFRPQNSQMRAATLTGQASAPKITPALKRNNSFSNASSRPERPPPLTRANTTINASSIFPYKQATLPKPAQFPEFFWFHQSSHKYFHPFTFVHPNIFIFTFDFHFKS